jgi:hypothetical protein
MHVTPRPSRHRAPLKMMIDAGKASGEARVGKAIGCVVYGTASFESSSCSRVRDPVDMPCMPCNCLQPCNLSIALSGRQLRNSAWGESEVRVAVLPRKDRRPTRLESDDWPVWLQYINMLCNRSTIFLNDDNRLDASTAHELQDRL